jgi:hypothetical protein
MRTVDERIHDEWLRTVFPVRTYDEARALVGSKPMIASVTFGRYRYVHYETRDGGAIAARLFETDIVTWHPDGRVVLDTNGWNTPTTFDGMATALGIQRVGIGTRRYVPHLFGEPFEANRIFNSSTVYYTLTIHPKGVES